MSELIPTRTRLDVTVEPDSETPRAPVEMRTCGQCGGKLIPAKVQPRPYLAVRCASCNLHGFETDLKPAEDRDDEEATT